MRACVLRLDGGDDEGSLWLDGHPALRREFITKKMRIKMVRLLLRIISYLSYNYRGDDLDLGCPLWLHQQLCCLYA